MAIGDEYPKSYSPDTGKELPPEQIGPALQNRAITWQPGTKLPMTAPDGSRFDVPAEHVWSSIDSGWQLESPEQAKLKDFEKISEEHPILSGLTAFGNAGADVNPFFGPIVKRALAPDLARDLPYIEEANPVSTTAGIVAGSLIPGPGGAVGGLLRGGAEVVGAGRAIEGLVAAGSGSRIGRALLSGGEHAITGAVEMGGWSAGNELVRQSFSRDDLNVERLLSAAGEGALLGGGIGGALGFAGKLGGETIAKSAEGSAGLLNPEMRAFRSIEGNAADIRKLGPERAKEIGGELLKRRSELLSPLEGLPVRAEKITAAKATVGDEIGSVLKRLDESGAKPDMGRVQETIGGYLAELRSTGTGPKIRLARQLERDFGPAIKELDTFEGLQNFRRKELSAEVYGELNAVKKERLAGFERTVEEALEHEIKTASPEAFASYNGLKTMYGNLSAAETIATRQAAGVTARKALGLGDMAAGGIGLGQAIAIGSGGLGGAALSIGSALVRKAVRSERTQSVLAQAFDAVRGGIDSSGLKVSNSVRQLVADGATETARRVPPTVSKIYSTYEAKSAATRDAKSNLPLAAARIAVAVQPIAQVDPTMARKTTAKITGDLQWLTSKLPQNPSNTAFVPPAKIGATKGGRGKVTSTSANVSLTDAAKFTRYERALTAPTQEIRRVAKTGRMSPELLEVLHERRPAIQGQVRQEMVEKMGEMAQRGKTMSRTARVQMSLLSGAPLDRTMTPQFIASVQSVWQEHRAQTEKPLSPPRREVGARIRDRARERLSAGDDVGDDIA